MRVLSTPDYRSLVPYQQLLGEALEAEGYAMTYGTGYHRALPVARSITKQQAELVHLHWIDFLFRKGPSDTMRMLRLPTDIRLARWKAPVVYTVHDLFPTGWPEQRATARMVGGVLRAATELIVHSPGARDVVCERFGASPRRCTVIPHGDLAAAYGEPIPRARARAQFGLRDGEKVCLAFGAILPNKGMAELVEWWVKARPGVTLAVVGHNYDRPLGERIQQAAVGAPNVRLFFGFQSDPQLNAWFSACDCAVINYNVIFTSGVACLARSYGVPTLLPHRLKTVDLMEPHPLVFRYTSLEDGFGEALDKAVAAGPDLSAAREWRRETSWENVAKQTASVYRRAREN